MSRAPGSRPNGYGGYANGYNNGGGGYGGYGGGGYDAPDDDYQRRPSDEPRRRPGGYGGFISDREDDVPQVTRPTSLERTQARRRSREVDYGSGSRSRSRTGAGRFGPGSQQMEEILQYIQQNWDFMTDDKCVPIEVALKLMDSSSLGLADQYDRFRQTHQELQRALKAIVNGKALPLYCMPRSSGADQRNRTPPRI